MKEIFDFAYIMTFISQVAFSFVMPVAIWFGIGYLLTEKLGLGKWALVLCIVFGVFSGAFAMFKYIITMADKVTNRKDNKSDDEDKSK